ncbi:MAG: hypothetical protein ACYDGO_03855 [Smithellaceae bacterium]
MKKASELKLNNKGFTLVVVLILSLVITLLGGTAMYLAATNFKTTAADLKYNLAEKTSNAGLLNAFDEINKAGTGGSDRTIAGAMGNADYSTNIMFGGKNLWFLSSAGSIGNSRVVKTALFQGYYGAGLYTVRGNVKATLGDSSRLSGCDASPDPDCFVPAFIASGTINTGRGERKACTAAGAADGTTAGLYGAPVVLNMGQGDLSRIFFKVGCFNKYNNAGCTTSLLDYLEYDYGRNPTDNRQDFSFGQNDNGFGIPVVSIPALPAVPGGGSCIFPVATPPVSGLTLNLSSNLTNCSEIVLNSAISTVTIQGDGIRSGVPVKIYTNGNNNTPIFSNASNFSFYTTNNDKTVTISNSSNFTIHSTNEVTLNNTNSNFTLYNKGVTNLNGMVSGTAANPFRIVSANTINTGAGISLTNGNIMTGPAAVADTNSVAAPQNLVAGGNITIHNANVFARHIRFASHSTVRILDGLIYVYAYACPDCSRAASDSSLNTCRANDNRWCGWYGENISLNIGRAADGTARPVLFISNNTTVQTVNPTGTAYIWGIWYGEDVTYLAWNGNNISQNLSGFLVRNFPPDLTLGINISGSGFKMNFSKPMIDQVANKYRFFREVECVRDPLTPKAQLIQTRMTNY